MSLVSLTLVAAVVGAGAAAWGAWLARGTTAVPAAVWAMAAWLVVAAEMALRQAGGFADPAAAANVRLVATALAVCPVLALLGAKRPQHGVWQFIVATLAVVLVMPAASAALTRPGGLPAVHLLEKWLILVLVVVGWMNFIGTRRGLAATLIAAGQLAVVRPFLPGFDTAAQVESILRVPGIDGLGAVAAALGAGLAGGQGWLADRGRARTFIGGHPLAASVDRPFLALRETLGAAWALRIAERFDAIAADRGWPCRLTFKGLVVAGHPQNPAGIRDAQRAFAALMRRFVTIDWLRRHA